MLDDALLWGVSSWNVDDGARLLLACYLKTVVMGELGGVMASQIRRRANRRTPQTGPISGNAAPNLDCAGAGSGERRAETKKTHF